VPSVPTAGVAGEGDDDSGGVVADVQWDGVPAALSTGTTTSGTVLVALATTPNEPSEPDAPGASCVCVGIEERGAVVALEGAASETRRITKSRSSTPSQ